MIFFGWLIVTLGAVGLCSSMALEIMMGDPFLMLIAKSCLGAMAIGGTILGIESLRRK